VRVSKSPDIDFLIGEMVRPGAMADMIDDSFANYVVQTALDFAQAEVHAQLVAEILPLLPTIKSRSWYKRILTKLGLTMNPNLPQDPNRYSLRALIDEGAYSTRMAPDPRPLGPMHPYQVLHPQERDHRPPPGFAHGAPGSGAPPSDRNGYRISHQHNNTGHSQVPPQYGNFYPYGPRQVSHHPDYRPNNEY
jgi:hypothetical protein